MLKNTLLKKKSILLAGAALIVTIGIGLITMSGAKFTADVRTGENTIKAGILEPLDYTLYVAGTSTEITNIPLLFSNIYPGWSTSIDVEVKTTSGTTLDANWAPLLGGSFITSSSALDAGIVVDVEKLGTPVGDFEPDPIFATGKTLATLKGSAVNYKDSTSTTAGYVKLGSGKLLRASGDTAKFRLTFSLLDADEGVLTFEGMKTYSSEESDNLYMGISTKFDLVFKAVVLD